MRHLADSLALLAVIEQHCSAAPALSAAAAPKAAAGSASTPAASQPLKVIDVGTGKGEQGWMDPWCVG